MFMFLELILIIMTDDSSDAFTLVDAEKRIFFYTLYWQHACWILSMFALMKLFIAAYYTKKNFLHPSYVPNNSYSI